MNTNLPIIARLNPPPATPEGMTALDSPILQGLPHIMALLPRWRAVLTLPLGVATTLRALPSATLISSATAETTAAPATEPPALPVRPAARLRLQRDGTTVAVLPLAAGLMADVAEADGGVRLRLLVRDWALHAGTLMGAGDHGSYLRLSVAVADAAVDEYGPLPPSPAVLARLPEGDRMESRRGFAVAMRLSRLHQLKARLR